MCCKFIANKVYVQEKKFNVKLFILLINRSLRISRVSGGNFTLPSLGTVLDSLPSHGSSYLTLLFLSLYSLLT